MLPATEVNVPCVLCPHRGVEQRASGGGVDRVRSALTRAEALHVADAHPFVRGEVLQLSLAVAVTITCSGVYGK